MKSLGSVVMGLLLVACGCWFGMTSDVRAESHDALTPLLVGLDGWEAGDPEGMSMNMGGMKMISAVRDYSKNDLSLTALVMVGSQAMAQVQAEEMDVDTGVESVKVATIDGFKVQHFYDKQEKSGSVVVFLVPGDENGAIFTFSYTGLAKNEGLDLARRFDWKKMQSVTRNLM